MKIIKSNISITSRNGKIIRNICFSDLDERWNILKHPTEADHRLRGFIEWARWTGYDNFTFLMTAVGLVCADKRILKDDDLYKILRYLSNTVGAMIQPEITEDDMDHAQGSSDKFAFNYKDYFKDRACTWKFHMSQHFVEFLRRFGSAAYFDNFNLEKLNGQIVKRVTTRRRPMKQMVTNFLLHNHSEPLLKRESYHEKTKQFLNNLGLKTIYSFDNDWHAHDEEAQFSRRSDDESVEGFRRSFPELSHCMIRRQTCVSKGKVVVTSEKFDHQGKADNSHILLKRSIMGRVLDILEVQCGENSRFFFSMNIIRRSLEKPDATEECEDGTPKSRTFPDNQFIAEQTEEMLWTEACNDDLVQKMFHGYTTFLFNGIEKTCLYIAVQINCAY